MNIATKPKPTPLAERIAKVRKRMLVATLTKVPPSNKELFIALCKIYEESNTEKSSFSSGFSYGPSPPPDDDDEEEDSFVDWNKSWR